MKIQKDGKTDFKWPVLVYDNGDEKVFGKRKYWDGI
jgi:hypothetical protein